MRPGMYAGRRGAAAAAASEVLAVACAARLLRYRALSVCAAGAGLCSVCASGAG